MIQTHDIYYTFNFYYYYISPTSNHQALDPGGWRPLHVVAASPRKGLPCYPHGGGLVSQLCPTLSTPWTVTGQAPRCMDSPSKNNGLGCHFHLQGIFPTQGLSPGLLHCRKIWATREALRGSTEVKVAQSCQTLCNPMDWIFHGILQARILERVAFPFSRGSSQPRDRTQVSHIAGGFFTSSATRKAQEYWSG